MAVPTVTESPVVTVTLSPVVNDVYAAIAVPTVTLSPVVTLPSLIVNIPLEYVALAAVALVTTVFFEILGTFVVEPPVTTVFLVTPVTTVFFEILGMAVVVPPVTTSVAVTVKLGNVPTAVIELTVVVLTATSAVREVAPVGLV